MPTALPLAPAFLPLPPDRRLSPPPHIGSLHVAIELEIPSDIRLIERVVEVVARQCEQLEFSARQVSLNVPVALTEALSNAILRGNAEAVHRRVQVRCDVNRERLVLEVVDEGAGFDLERCLVDPTTPEQIVREDGRGLFLMARLMDSVERFTNHGNVVRLTLHRHD